MNKQLTLPRFLLHGLALGGVSLALSGCVAYREPEPRYRSYPPPPERVSAPIYDDEPVYEPPPREAVVTYERDLSPYGHWVDVREYGRCWVPNDRARGWRPYTVGHWVDTEDGWCWVAEDREAEWGHITYHYGRWYEDASYGWLWVPGTTWAPAWVAWRGGDGYCGWAPLPPRVGYRDVDVRVVDRYVPADRYVYCEERYLGEPRIHDHFVRNDVTIINRTTNITNITYVNNRVVNRGVSVTEVERYSGRRVERVPLARAATEADVQRYRREGRPVAYQPEAIVQADEVYRQRVERRQVDAKANEKARAERRSVDNTIDRQQQRDRADRRVTDAEVARQQERDRAARRSTDNTVDRQQERDRVDRRMTDAEVARQQERDRAARRSTDNTVDRQQERDRADRRATDAETARQQERDRAARRAEDAKATAKPETGRTPRTPAETEAARVERERAAKEAARTAEDRSKVDEKPADPNAKHTRTRTDTPADAPPPAR